MKLNKIHIDRGYTADGPLKGKVEFQSPEKYKFMGGRRCQLLCRSTRRRLLALGR